MSVDLSIDIAGATFGDLLRFVDTARAAGVSADTVPAREGTRLTFALPATGGTRPTAPETPAPAAAPAASGGEPVSLTEVLRGVAAAEPAVARLFESLGKRPSP